MTIICLTYLTFQYSCLNETFFKNVFKLDPGHYFIYKDKDDYAQFMSLLESYNVSDNEKTLNLKLVNYPDTLYLSDGLKANQKMIFQFFI